jgi:hypothetical protein
MNLIQHVDDAYHKAERNQSKITKDILNTANRPSRVTYARQIQ